jgi:mRNA interferase MazF
MVKTTVPDRGDIILMDFHPQKGREQSGRRPALVLSRRSYNTKARLAVLCPITSKTKGYYFEVPLPSGLKTKGVIMVDQIKSMDWTERQLRIIERVPSTVHQNILEKLTDLIS